VILQSPPPIPSIILREHGWWNLWLLAAPVAFQVPPELDGMKTAPRVQSPALFILTGRDSVVPLTYQRNILDLVASEKRTILLAEMEHNDPITGANERELQRGLDWLWERARHLK
jgi:hypothetical protein